MNQIQLTTGMKGDLKIYEMDPSNPNAPEVVDTSLRVEHAVNLAYQREQARVNWHNEDRLRFPHWNLKKLSPRKPDKRGAKIYFNVRFHSNFALIFRFIGSLSRPSKLLSLGNTTNLIC